MKTSIWISAVGLALAGSLFAQTTPDQPLMQLYQLRYDQLAGVPASMIPVAGEVTPIVGRPYSAVGRTIEYSPDGNHVDRSDTTKVYRDEQGRTRREMNGGKMIGIVDPVSGIGYSLQTETRTAMKRSLGMARAPLSSDRTTINLRLRNQSVKTLFETVGKVAGINVLFDPDMPTPTKNQFNLDLENSTMEQALDAIALMTKSEWKQIGPAAITVSGLSANQSKAPQPSLFEAAREQAQRMSGGAGGGRGRGATGNASNVTVDDLGTQMVNGVSAQGVRTTSIIPTGTFGNDRDIKTVTERWVSSDLHVLVKSVYTDSRTGTTTYDLLNIVQAPPDPSLFMVPAGYTVQEGGGRGARGGGAVPQAGR